MGTPDFAVPSLKKLVEQGHEIVCVVCQSDKPKGRGMKLTPPPVKEYALTQGLRIEQPETLRDHAIEGLLNETKPEMIVVLAYGKILPGYVLDYPKYGCVNIHGSLLPKYRGAAPIQRAVINGEKVTGVTSMYLDRGVDTGDMIFKREMPIEAEDTSETMFEKLAHVGADLLIETIDAIIAGTAPRIKQDDSQSCYASMLSREEAVIDWNWDADRICNFIRGCWSWPVASTTLDGARVRLISAKPVKNIGGEVAPGTVIGLTKDGLRVRCGDGCIDVTKIQFEGSRPMPPADYFRGHASIDAKRFGVENA